MTDFNLLPTITHNPETDKTRLSLVIDHYAVMKKGSPAKSRAYPKRGPVIPAVGSLRGVHKPSIPSYSDIETENTIHDPADYEIIIKAEITPGMDVLLNGILIASAPENKQMVTGKNKKLTQPERARFCRGVIWWLMNDQICLKDKLSEIGYRAPVAMPVPVTAEDLLVEHITGTALPGPGLIPVMEYDLYVESVIQKEMIDEGPEDPVYEGFFKDQNDCEIREYLRSIEPAPVDVIRSWSIPQLRITIQECVLA
jgi:hypothetical protein